MINYLKKNIVSFRVEQGSFFLLFDLVSCFLWVCSEGERAEAARWVIGLVFRDLINLSFFESYALEMQLTSFVGYRQKWHQRSGLDSTISCSSNLSAVAWKTRQVDFYRIFDFGQNFFKLIFFEFRMDFWHYFIFNFNYKLLQKPIHTSKNEFKKFWLKFEIRKKST